jgi:hypothetical protein
MVSSAADPSHRRLPVAIGLAVLAITACSPNIPPLQVGTRIACGGFPTAPTLAITLDSTSATAPGVITIAALGDSLNGNAAVVEYGSMRCAATAGSFQITIREATAVAGQLRVAAAQPLPITIRSADGTVRAQTSFDPNADEPTTLRWDALE